MSYGLCQYRYFVCPIEYSEVLGRMTMDCEPSSLFRPQEYTLPESLQKTAEMVNLRDRKYEKNGQPLLFLIFLTISFFFSVQLENEHHDSTVFVAFFVNVRI